MYLKTEENLNHKIYSTITVKRAKQIQIIGDPNNQRPDQLSSAVHVSVTVFRPCDVLYIIDNTKVLKYTSYS